jgi:hypothetical protein
MGLVGATEAKARRDRGAWFVELVVNTRMCRTPEAASQCAIVAPFPHISDHVSMLPWTVSTWTASWVHHRVRRTLCTTITPGQACLWCGVSPGIGHLGVSPGGPHPFGLCWQAFAHPSGKLIGFSEGDTHDRLVGVIKPGSIHPLRSPCPSVLNKGQVVSVGDGMDVEHERRHAYRSARLKVGPTTWNFFHAVQGFWCEECSSPEPGKSANHTSKVVHSRLVARILGIQPLFRARKDALFSSLPS